MQLISKTIRLDSNDISRFERLYSGLLSIFLRKAIKAVLKDKQLFDKIFFEN